MRGWVIGLVVAVMGVAAAAVIVIVAATSSSETALLDLEPGDCFDLPADLAREVEVDTIETVDVIACDVDHEAEVIVTGTLNDDRDRPYPSDDELFLEIDQRCREGAEEVGNEFGVVPIAPTEASWTTFAGRFLCLAIPYGGGPTRGSVTGG